MDMPDRHVILNYGKGALVRILFFITVIFCLSASAAPVAYHALADLPLLGQGGWDYPSLDPESHRLFISHSDRVVVIDTETNKVLTEITDTPGVHGIAIAADLGKAYSSNGKEDKVSVIDLKTLISKSKISVGEKPDAIAYDPGQHEVYVFNGKSQSVTVIDGRKDKVVATLKVPGKPEFAAVDSEAHRVYVNVEDKNSILAIDTVNHTVAAVWPLENCESPTGLAIDIKNHRLFSVCENEKMVMVDAQTGKTVASAPTGQGTDGVVFDALKMLAFSANGKSATITVVHEDSPNHLTVVQNLKSHRGARTITIHPGTGRIYLPAADFEPSVGEARPKMIEGTQKILVFSP
jgi:YVTN family beta-propeller protein